MLPVVTASSSMPPSLVPSSSSIEYKEYEFKLVMELSDHEFEEDLPMVIESSKSKVDEAESFSSQTCPYRQLCKRFLNTLSLPGNPVTT